MVKGMDYMYSHFLKFGLEIHLGRGTAKSKTEAMFFPKPRCDDGSTPSDFPCADGFISYTRIFKYLGSHIVPGLDSTEEISDERVDYLAFFWGSIFAFHNTDSRVAATPDEISQLN